MRGMILGDIPEFEWINTRLQEAETAINEDLKPHQRLTD